jgi:uncharacterized protein
VESTDLLLAMLILVVASALQGAVGFGSNIVAAPLLLLIDSVYVPGPLIVASLILNGLMMWRDREPVEPGHIGLALVGRVPGSFLGAAVLTALSTEQLGTFVGLVVLAAVALSVVGGDIRPTRPAIVGAGALSGFMGTSVSIGGPPIALLYQHEAGPRFRSIVARVLIYGAVISLATLALVGEFGRDELVASVLLVPGCLLGFSVSGPLARHLDRGYTRAAILGVSALSAVAVIAKAVL